MEQGQNGTKKKDNQPTAEERMRIFMQYPGQEFIINDYGKATAVIKFRLGSIEVLDPMSNHNGHFSIPPDEAYVNLKPLGRISDEHKVALEQLCGMKNSRQTLQMILFDLHNRTSIVGPNVHWVQIITDQCREWGYAVPYKNWSVEQLVEFGIYKLSDK